MFGDNKDENKMACPVCKSVNVYRIEDSRGWYWRLRRMLELKSKDENIKMRRNKDVDERETT
jgi:hypothetical protein